MPQNNLPTNCLHNSPKNLHIVNKLSLNDNSKILEVTHIAHVTDDEDDEDDPGTSESMIDKKQDADRCYF